jgi:hypothetical protein
MNQYISVECSLARCSAAGVLTHMVCRHKVSGVVRHTGVSPRGYQTCCSPLCATNFKKKLRIRTLRLGNGNTLN